MQPRAIGAEEDFVGTSTFDRLDEVVEAADAGGVGVDVGVARHLVGDAQVGAPVVGEATGTASGGSAVRKELVV